MIIIDTDRQAFLDSFFSRRHFEKSNFIEQEGFDWIVYVGLIVVGENMVYFLTEKQIAIKSYSKSLFCNFVNFNYCNHAINHT